MDGSQRPPPGSSHERDAARAGLTARLRLRLRAGAQPARTPADPRRFLLPPHLV